MPLPSTWRSQPPGIGLPAKLQPATVASQLSGTFLPYSNTLSLGQQALKVCDSETQHRVSVLAQSVSAWHSLVQLPGMSPAFCGAPRQPLPSPQSESLVQSEV